MRYKSNRRGRYTSLPKIKYQRRNYLWWFKYLKLAVLDNQKVDKSKYKVWNLDWDRMKDDDYKFDEWWKHGQHLVHPDNEKIKLSTPNPRPDSYKVRYEVLRLKLEDNLSHDEIMEKLNKKNKRLGGYYISTREKCHRQLMWGRKHLKQVCLGTFP